MYISVKINPYSQLVVQWPFKWPAKCNSVKTNLCSQLVVQWPFKWPAKCNSVKTNPCSQLVVQWPFNGPAKCNSVKTNPYSQLVVQWPFKWPVKCNSVKTNPYSQYAWLLCLVFLTCPQMLMLAIAHKGCTDTVLEYALKVDSGRKIHNSYTGDSNPRQYCAWLFGPTVY